MLNRKRRIDNNASTYWLSAQTFPSTPQWLLIDLGAKCDITGYTMNTWSGGEYLTAFKVQGSNDGTNFVDLDTKTGLTSSDLNVSGSFARVSYRYVRLYINGVFGAGNYAVVREFRIMGERVSYSSNKNLSSLVPSTGTLSPVFASETISYTMTVGNGVSSMTFTPTVADTGKATATVNGTTVTSGQASQVVNLNIGANAIPVVVTAEDGSTKTYTVTVTRAAPTYTEQ